MHIVDSIFPSLTGNLIIGNYPHSMTREDATRLCREDKIPFCVIEMDGSEMTVVIRCHSLEAAIAHHGTNRWIVFPPNFKGDSSAIYSPREIPMFWER